MFQKEHPLLVRRGIQKCLLFVQRQQRTRVVAHDVRERDVTSAGKQVRHECHGLTVWLEKKRNHLAFRVSVCKKDIPPFDAKDIFGHLALSGHPFQLATFRKGKQVFRQKGCFLPGIGFDGPLPVRSLDQ